MKMIWWTHQARSRLMSRELSSAVSVSHRSGALDASQLTGVGAGVGGLVGVGGAVGGCVDGALAVGLVGGPEGDADA